MTQEEIESRALELYPVRKRLNKKGTGEFDANLPRRKAYIQGWMDAYPKIKGQDIIERVNAMKTMDKRANDSKSILY